MKELLREGVLYPALNHVDPSWIPSSCASDISTLLDEMHREDRAVFDDAVEVLQGLVEHEAYMIEKFQQEEGIEGASRHSNLTCLDILANDFDKVFLMAFNWIDPKEASGLVFDADLLIKKGVAIRSGDLLEHYRESLKKVISENLRSGEYEEAFKEGIGKVLDRNEWRGEAARQFLDDIEKEEKAKTRSGRKGEVELVFEGPIPLEWAIEAWQDGKKIPLK